MISAMAHPQLTVRAAVPVALKLPGCVASDVDAELVESRVGVVARELHRELQLILRYDFAAHYAVRTQTRPALDTDRSSGRQLSGLHHLSGLRAQNSLVGHDSSPGVRRMVMPDARRPDARSACREPGG